MQEATYVSSVGLEVLDVSLHGEDLGLSYRGRLWKQLQPLVLYHASEGVEDSFELLLNLLLGSHHNQLVVTCPSSSDQVSQGEGICLSCVQGGSVS